LKNKCKTHGKLLKEEQERRSCLQSKVEHLKSENKSLEGENTKKQRDLKSRIEELAKENKDLKVASGDLEERLVKAEKTIKQQQSRIEDLEAESMQVRESLKSKEAELEFQIGGLAKENKDLEATNVNLEDHLAKAEETVQQQQSRIEDLEAESMQVREELKSTKTRLIKAKRYIRGYVDGKSICFPVSSELVNVEKILFSVLFSIPRENLYKLEHAYGKLEKDLEEGICPLKKKRAKVAELALECAENLKDIISGSIMALETMNKVIKVVKNAQKF